MARGDGFEPPLVESKSTVLTDCTNPSCGGSPFSDKPVCKRYTVFIVDYGYHSTQKHYNTLMGILKRGVFAPLIC